MTKPEPPADIERSWTENAARWTDIVRSGGIASRKLATDAAVLRAIIALAPVEVLDLGCGEGWLARQLARQGIRAVGTDASAPLVAAAKALGDGVFHVLDYAAIAENPGRFGTRFDAVVANFSLLGEDLGSLLDALPVVVRDQGALIVQTVHPSVAAPPYRDGWRLETFAGFGDGERWAPMPWYFRTIASWHALLSRRWRITMIEEPVHPQTGEVLSLLMTARPRSG